MRPHNVTEGYAKPGPRLFPAQVHRIIPLRLELHFAGDGPHEGGHFPGDGGVDDIDVLALGGELSVSFAEPDLGFPGDIPDARWQLLLADLEES